MPNNLAINKKALAFTNQQKSLMQHYSSMLYGLGITNFYYVKVYYDSGKYLHLGPHEDLNIYYAANIHTPSPILTEFIEGEFNEFIWPMHTVNVKEDFFFTWLHEHNISNGFFIRRCSKDFYECWSFSSSVQNSQIMYVYSHIRPKLYRFIKYFNHAAASMLKEAESYLGQYDNPIKMPSVIIPPSFSAEIPWLHEGKEIKLSTEQLKCLSQICMGLTYKQIAQELDKSARTVEFHINSIKEKLGVRLTTEVIKFYNQNMECNL